MQENRCSSHYVIDFQGFIARGKFLIQEFAAFHLEDQAVVHYFFSHDHHQHATDNLSYFLMKGLHKINKSFGSSDFSRLTDFFNNNLDATFYVIGDAKCSILSKFCKNKIINLESISSSFHVENRPHLKCEFPDHNIQAAFPFCSLKRVVSFGSQFLERFPL